MATKNDTHDTIETPHGTIVDHVNVPGFYYDSKDLNFDFLNLNFGSNKDRQGQDECLEVKFRVRRESSYYDRNIIPLIALLNIVGVCLLALTPEDYG